MHGLAGASSMAGHSSGLSVMSGAGCPCQSADTVPAAAAPPMEGHGSHDVAHLCVAVLGGAILIAVGLLLLRGLRPQRSSHREVGAFAVARGPPRQRMPRHLALLSVLLL